MEVAITTALPARPDVVSSDSVRERFHAVDGLRALAVLALAVYELAKVFPPIFVHRIAHAAAFASVHGFDVLAMLAGFSLAYPAFAVARHDGKAAFPLGRFAVKRIARVLPAYAVVVALTVLVPVVAHRIGFQQLAGPSAALPSLGAILAALRSTAHVPFDNDALWGVGAIARCYVLLPLILVLWLRFPAGVLLVALGAATADLMSPLGHALGAGALAAFALGAVAADLRTRNDAIQRFGLLLFAGAAVAAVAAEPTFAHFPGSAAPGAPLGYVENPLWQLAFFGLLAASGAFGWVERAFALRLFAFVAAASFAIALACEPMLAFMIRATTPALAPPLAAINAYLMAIAAGIALWAAVDRWFLDGLARKVAAERIGGLLDAILRPVHLDRIVLRSPGAIVDEGLAGEAPQEGGYYAPPPRPEPTDLASVKRRIGSADDLAAEILATKHRLAEKSAELFDDPKPETPKPVFRKPGFHGAGFSNAGATPEPAPMQTVQPLAPPQAPPAAALAAAQLLDDEEPRAPQGSPFARAAENTGDLSLSKPPPADGPPRRTGLSISVTPRRAEPERTSPPPPASPPSTPAEPIAAAEPSNADGPPPLAHPAPLPEFELADASLGSAAEPDDDPSPPLDPQRFMAALDTLATGDGSFDSAPSREFAELTLGDVPVSLDLPTAPHDAPPHAELESAVEVEEPAETRQPEPPRRVKMTLRPDRPMNVYVGPDTARESDGNGRTSEA